MGRGVHEGRVLSNQEVAPGIFRMAIDAPDVAISARAGQFCMLKASCKGADDPLLRRPLSIHDAVDGTVWFLYRVMGRGTRQLSLAGQGDPIELVGPLGRPFPSLSDGPLLFVGGGMGVAPLGLLARQRRGLVALVGARTRRELLLPDDIILHCDEVVVATEDGSEGLHGLVTGLLEQRLEMDGARLVFTCGPMPMMAAVWRLCERHGVSCWASLETVMACGAGLCMGCAVNRADGGYLHVCFEGPVVDAGLVAW